MADDNGGDIGSFLSEKRLGAPTWLWGVIFVAVVSGIYLYIRNKKAASTSTTGTDSSAAGSVAGITQPTGYPANVNNTRTNYYTNPATTPPPPANPIPGALSALTMGTYTVKGTNAPTAAGESVTPVSDQYPGGIAAIVYNLQTTDAANVGFDAMAIFLANPGKVPPYAVGTQISYPLPDSQDRWSLAPSQATTLSTTVAGAPTSASGS